MDQIPYDRLLVARRSEKNKCYTPDGEILIIAGTNDAPEGRLRPDDHFFVGVHSRIPSVYGWVSMAPKPYTVNEFIRDNGLRNTDEEVGRVTLMLNSISRLPEGTPVVARYQTVGVMSKQRRLIVHKVLFHHRD